MVAKVSIGKSFGGMCRYVFDGGKEQTQDKGAVVLATEGVRAESAAQMARDFERQRTLNPRLGRAVWHTALAFHPQDAAKLTDEKLVAIAQEYMRRVGLADTQYAVVKHQDTAHPHVHLVANRVNDAGKTISDQFSHGRSQEAAQQIAQVYGLTVASEKGRAVKEQQVDQLPAREQAKVAIHAAVRAHQPRALDLGELAERLAPEGIRMQVTYQKGQPQAVVFALHDFHIKGSEVDRAFSGRKLHEALEAQRPALTQQRGQEAKLAQELQGLSDQLKAKELNEGLAGLGAALAKQQQQQVSLSPSLSSKKRPDAGLEL